MRSYASVMVGALLLAIVWCFPGPLGLVLGSIAWSQGEDWAWIPLVAGLACSVPIPFMALNYARRQFPRITRGDREKHADIPYGDETFVLWAPRSPQGHPQARLARADVLEASLVRYNPDGEASYTSYPGAYTPNEFTPLIRLKLRVHGVERTDTADETDGSAGPDAPVACCGRCGSPRRPEASRWSATRSTSGAWTRPRRRVTPPWPNGTAPFPRTGRR